MRGRELAVCLLLVMGSIIGCGRDRRTQATDMCKEIVREAEAPGGWEDADRTGVHLSVTTVHAISPERMWEVRFDELPVSQSKTMDTGIAWAASIEIIHAVQVTYRDGEEAEWIDVHALCLAESNERMRVTFSIWPLY